MLLGLSFVLIFPYHWHENRLSGGLDCGFRRNDTMGQENRAGGDSWS